MNTPVSASSDLDRDQLLADILDGLIAQLRQGQAPDVEAIAAQHPKLAEEIRQLWAAVQFAEEFARPVANSALTVDLQSAGLAAQLRLPLPRDFGDYELLEELGRGGMGVVYKARQNSLNRIVALKMILRGELASGRRPGAFQAEAEAAGPTRSSAHRLRLRSRRLRWPGRTSACSTSRARRWPSASPRARCRRARRPS